MTLTAITVEIERVSVLRQRAWTDGDEPGMTTLLTRQLADLYEEKRALIAKSRTGRTRADILRGARVESELERLTNR